MRRGTHSCPDASVESVKKSYNQNVQNLQCIDSLNGGIIQAIVLTFPSCFHIFALLSHSMIHTSPPSESLSDPYALTSWLWVSGDWNPWLCNHLRVVVCCKRRASPLFKAEPGTQGDSCITDVRASQSESSPSYAFLSHHMMFFHHVCLLGMTHRCTMNDPIALSIFRCRETSDGLLLRAPRVCHLCMGS